MTSLDEYTISYLLEGETWLLRGFADDGDEVLIAMANPALPVSTQERRLARELQLRNRLSPDWAAQPKILTRVAGHSALLLRDPGGYPLKRKVGQKLSVEEFLPLAVSLTAAVGKMHAAGIVHRDINPSHLLVAQGSQTYITGFGIAQIAGERYSSQFEVCNMVGTLAYLAPEQTGRTKHEVDKRVDLYSLGAIFFQLLTGVLPFIAGTAAEWLHAHIAISPPDPAGYVPGIPKRLSRMVLRLLNKTPDDRYHSASELLGELESCLEAWSAHAEIGESSKAAATSLVRARTAEEYLASGRNALSRAAYSAARSAFNAGLTEDCDTSVALCIQLGIAECDFRVGDALQAKERLERIAADCHDEIQLADVVRLQIAVHTALDQSDLAVDIGLNYLSRFGLVPSSNMDGQIDAIYQRLISEFHDGGTKKLIGLAPMHDESCRAAMSVLAELISPASFMSKHLRDLVPAWMTMLSLENGNAASSCIAYVHLGMVMGPRTGQYGVGYSLGLVGLELSASESSRRFRPKVSMCFGALLLPWTRPYSEGLVYIRSAFEEGRQEGDVNFAAYSRNQIVSNLLASSAPLAEIRHEIDMGLTFAREIGLRRVVDILLAQSGFINTLNGRGREFGEIIPLESQRREYEQRLCADRSLSVAAFCYWVRKLQAKVIASDYLSAWGAGLQASKLEWTAAYFPEVVDFHFYGALAACALLHGPSSDGSTGNYRSAFKRHRSHIDEYAANAPDNFKGKQLLLEAAEQASIGNVLAALRLCEESAIFSDDRGNLQDAGLAYTLAAHSCLSSGLSRMAHMYAEKACQTYEKWGAKGIVGSIRKAFQTDKEGDGLSRQPFEFPLPADSHLYSSLAALDVEAVLSASNALVGELNLEKLLAQLLTNTIKHGAAERGILLLHDLGKLSIAGSACIQDGKIVVTHGASGLHYCKAILEHALELRTDVFMDDAKSHPVFRFDEDVRSRSVRSVACLLLQKQSILTGLLYMENNLISGAFTPSRAALLAMLASQATMAIENGRLYGQLVTENADRQKMQAELAHVSRVTSLGEMAASIAHEVGQPLAGIMTYGDACLRWLDKQPPNVEEVSKNIRKIIKEGERAAEIIQRVRALATKDTGRRALVDVNEMVKEAVSLIHFQATSLEIELSVRLEEGVPAIVGDRIQLQQVVVNIAVNAIQAMSALPKEAERRLSVATSASPDGGAIIAVDDSGPGISEDVIERLFDAFFTTRAEGLGMGLSICRSIVDGHGGRLWVEQKLAPHQGSAFFVSLPPKSSGLVDKQYHL